MACSTSSFEIFSKRLNEKKLLFAGSYGLAVNKNDLRQAFSVLK